MTADFFEKDFGFTGRETVAIMGAHTMGRLHYSISLFRYLWTTRGRASFNNHYYKYVPTVIQITWFLSHFYVSLRPRPFKFLQAFWRTAVRWCTRDILPNSTHLSTNHTTADQSKFNSVLSLIEKCVQGRNFHHTSAAYDGAPVSRKNLNGRGFKFMIT